MTHDELDSPSRRETGNGHDRHSRHPAPSRVAPPLDASRGDLEAWLGLSGGRYTRAAGPLWSIVAAVCTALFVWSMTLVPHWNLSRIMFQCWTNAAVVFLGLWCLFMLANKFNKTRIQERALRQEDLFPRRADFVLSPATAVDVLEAIR